MAVGQDSGCGTSGEGGTSAGTGFPDMRHSDGNGGAEKVPGVRHPDGNGGAKGFRV